MFQTKPYTISDFLEWNDKGQLELSPKFQRRGVWAPKAKSYLMDSIIRGKPFPKVLIREHVNPSNRRITREVVDGQQRLRAIFEFADDAFAISRSHNEEFAGKKYSQLPTSVQESILSYQVATDSLVNVSDAEVRDIFTRLNTYGVKLNAMELLNAEYYGEFKNAAFELGGEFYEFWTQNTVFTDKQIARMKDAELAAEVLIAIGDGVQDKAKLRHYFKNWDEALPNRNRLLQRFRATVDEIGNLFGYDLAEYRLNKPVLFYSLCCAVAHQQFGIPGLEKVKREKIKATRARRIQSSFSIIPRIWDEGPRTNAEDAFLDAANRATTHQPERLVRAKFFCDLIRK